MNSTIQSIFQILYNWTMSNEEDAVLDNPILHTYKDLIEIEFLKLVSNNPAFAQSVVQNMGFSSISDIQTIDDIEYFDTKALEDERNLIYAEAIYNTFKAIKPSFNDVQIIKLTNNQFTRQHSFD